MTPTPPDDDEDVDEASRESFPASDPPANTPETGIRIGDAEEPESPLPLDNQDE